MPNFRVVISDWNDQVIKASGVKCRALRIDRRLSQEGPANLAERVIAQAGGVGRGDSNAIISTL